MDGEAEQVDMGTWKGGGEAEIKVRPDPPSWGVAARALSVRGPGLPQGWPLHQGNLGGLCLFVRWLHCWSSGSSRLLTACESGSIVPLSPGCSLAGQFFQSGQKHLQRHVNPWGLGASPSGPAGDSSLLAHMVAVPGNSYCVLPGHTCIQARTGVSGNLGLGSRPAGWQPASI